MIQSITLKNLATISDTGLEFQPGLNVITGETGSGKSILMDGLMLATGKRADKAMVRPGTRNAFVEAVFSSGDGSETVIRREISLQGRSRIFIDDSLATLEDVRSAVQYHLELYSQRSAPALMKPSHQLDVLDEFAGAWSVRSEYKVHYDRYRELQRELSSLRALIESEGNTREVLLHEADLFSRLQPSADDYSELLHREKNFREAARRMELYSGAFQTVSGDDGVLASLSELLRTLGRDSAADDLTELLTQAEIALSEASSLIERELEAPETGSGEMAEIEERLDMYSRLISRFGGTIESLVDARQQLEEKLGKYDDAVRRIDELSEQLESSGRSLTDLAGRLSGKRLSGSEAFAEKVLSELKRLNMPWASFSVELEKVVSGLQLNGPALGACGAEKVVFQFSANRGIPSGTLDTVASGGELSRVALAVALARAGQGRASTLIFDEIDSGTGGETAGYLADSLLRASRNRQIIVISHLAQIASKAERHLAVEKSYAGGMPVTKVRNLTDTDSRRRELARLLGGGEGAMEHADNLIRNPDD